MLLVALCALSLYGCKKKDTCTSCHMSVQDTYDAVQKEISLRDTAICDESQIPAFKTAYAHDSTYFGSVTTSTGTSMKTIKRIWQAYCN
jgi:hypothetical protein